MEERFFNYNGKENKFLNFYHLRFCSRYSNTVEQLRNIYTYIKTLALELSRAQLLPFTVKTFLPK